MIANNNVGAGLHLNGTNGNINIPSGLQFIVSQNFGAIFNEAGDNVINGNLYVTAGGGDAYIVANAGTLTLNGADRPRSGPAVPAAGGCRQGHI